MPLLLPRLLVKGLKLAYIAFNTASTLWCAQVDYFIRSRYVAALLLLDSGGLFAFRFDVVLRVQIPLLLHGPLTLVLFLFDEVHHTHDGA